MVLATSAPSVPRYMPAARPVGMLTTLTMAAMGWSALTTAEPTKPAGTVQSVLVRKLTDSPGSAALAEPQGKSLPSSS